MPANDSIVKDARDQLTLVLSFFPRVDAKLSTVMALDTAMLAALSAGLPPLSQMTIWMAVAPALAAVLLGLSFYHLYRGSFPDVLGGHDSVVFFKEIAKRTETSFVAEYTRQSPESLRQDVLGQVWRNSEILTAKFRSLKNAYILMALGAIPWAFSLALFAVSKAGVQVLVKPQ